jgi:nitrogenase molybdenum-iron protein alpha/beta subunit
MSAYRTASTEECVICEYDADAYFGVYIVGVGFVCGGCYPETEGRDIEEVVDNGEVDV